VNTVAKQPCPRHEHSNRHAEGRETAGDDVQTPDHRTAQKQQALAELPVCSGAAEHRKNTSLNDTLYAFVSSVPRLAPGFWEGPHNFLGFPTKCLIDFCDNSRPFSCM